MLLLLNVNPRDKQIDHDQDQKRSGEDADLAGEEVSDMGC